MYSVLIVFIFVFVWLIFSKKSNTSSIPGPYGLPLIGNLHQLGSKIHESLTDLSRKHGEVFRIKLGSRPVVVLNGRRALQQALITQAIDFAGRPEHLPTLSAFNATRGGAYASTTYGESWKSQHKLLVALFHDFSDGSNREICEKHISEEAFKFIEFVLTKQLSPVFNAEVLIHHSIMNMMTRFLCSSHRELDDPLLKQILDTDEQLWIHWGKCTVLDALPWLNSLFPARLSTMKAHLVLQMELLKPHVDKTNQEYVEGSKRDVVHYIRTQSRDLDPAVREAMNLTEKKLLGVIYDLYPAGPYATLNWAFVYAIVFPDLQKEIQDEIDNAVGRGRIPSLADRKLLPLTDAFFAEVSRHAAVLPLTPPHCTTKDTVLGGEFNYAIPEGTMVICNLHSAFHDPTQWDNPSQFNPKRFLKKDGKSLDSEKVSSIMRFSGGQRMCPARNVGTLQLFLFFAVVMHQCTLNKIAGEDPTLEGRKFPLGVRPPVTKMELVRR